MCALVATKCGIEVNSDGVCHGSANRIQFVHATLQIVCELDSACLWIDHL